MSVKYSRYVFQMIRVRSVLNSLFQSTDSGNAARPQNTLASGMGGTPGSDSIGGMYEELWEKVS